MFRKLFIWALVLTALNLGCSSSHATPENQGSVYEIGLSLEQSEGDLKRSLQMILGILLEVANTGDTVSIFDAGRLERITSFGFHENVKIHNQKLRRKFINPGWSRLLAYIKQHQSNKTNADLEIPAFTRYLSSRKQEFPNRKMKALLIGSPLFFGDDEFYGGIASGNTFYPDITLSLSDSPWRTLGKEGRLMNVDIHHIWLHNPFTNEYCLEKNERFISLYYASQGASLLSYTGITSSYTRLGKSNLAPIIYEKNPNDTKVELHSCEMIKSALFGRRVSMNPPPPRNPISDEGIQVGVIWEGGKLIDVDIYAKFEKGEELSFRKHRTMKDEFSAFWQKDRETKWEIVKSSNSVKIDIRKVKVWLNLYSHGAKLKGSVKGQIRVLFNHNLYSMPFMIPAQKGDRGKSSRYKNPNKTWIPIDLEKIVGLS